METTIIKNTRQMITALENNIKKFQVIKELSQNISDAKAKRDKIINEDVKNIYNIAFKNLCAKKTPTDFTKDNHIYYVCNTGISRKQNNSYSLNADNINKEWYNDNKFAEELVLIGKNQTPFLKILSKQKKDIFKKFLKDVHLLSKGKNSLMKIDNQELKEYCGIVNKEFLVKDRKVIEIRIMREDLTIEIRCEDNTYNNNTRTFGESNLSTNNQTLKDFLLIEQLFTPIKKLLETELKLRTKELENTKRFMEYINTSFSSFLMFNELKK